MKALTNHVSWYLKIYCNPAFHSIFCAENPNYFWKNMLGECMVKERISYTINVFIFHLLPQNTFTSIIMVTCWRHQMKKIRVTGPLWGDSTGHRWIPLTKASDTELWCFLWSEHKQTVVQTSETPVIWDAIALIMASLELINSFQYFTWWCGAHGVFFFTNVYYTR